MQHGKNREKEEGRLCNVNFIIFKSVASIVFFPNVGDSVVAGEELGYFQFGGSTVVAVFPPNTVTWDSDLLAASSQGFLIFTLKKKKK